MANLANPNTAILCVDDEITVLETLEIELMRAFQNQYRYEFAESAEEALEVLRDLSDNGVTVVVIVSDWLMPGMKGDEFLIQVHRQFPRIASVLLTGQADPAAVERARVHGGLCACLSKPWSNQELIRTLQQIIH